jgi:hypothetical protein
MTPIRPYQPFDVTWLLPIAERYGEAIPFLSALKTLVAAWVVEPLAGLFLYRDEHGLAVAGLTDKAGVKSLIAIGRAIRSVCREFTSEPIHGHAKPGEWQYQLFYRLGFRGTDGIMYLEG